MFNYDTHAYFEAFALEEAKAIMTYNGHDIINLDIGNPDIAPPDIALETLKENAGRQSIWRYVDPRGLPVLRKAARDYYIRRFGAHIDPDPDANILMTLGAKEGMVSAASALLRPGDVVLVPFPSYPVHHFAFDIAGCKRLNYPAGGDDLVLALLAKDMACDDVRAILVCSPSNPTGMTHSERFIEGVLQMAREHNVYVFSDLAYAELYFDGEAPASLIGRGYDDIVIEFTTMSKSFGMAGARIGFACSASVNIKKIFNYKSYHDYGGFPGAQEAAAAVLASDQSQYLDSMRATYRKRRDVVVKSVIDAGWHTYLPEGGMFVWARLPKHLADEGSVSACVKILREKGVALAPGALFGQDFYVRIGLIREADELEHIFGDLFSDPRFRG